jgi:arginase
MVIECRPGIFSGGLIMIMSDASLAIIGAPTSAGAYGPGQEEAPAAIRAAGLISLLEAHGVHAIDKGNVPGYRWRVDKQNKRAMNVALVANVAKTLSRIVSESLAENKKLLIVGGDCTVELGVVAGCLDHSENIGLIYIDLDTDLNTPSSVEDGALDWMGVAHMLQLAGTDEYLSAIGKKAPMLSARQIHFFANGYMIDFERQIIDNLKIRETNLLDVAKDPVGAAKKLCQTWAPQFDKILIHLDVDVLDYVDMQLAENYRRNIGLRFDQLMMAVDEFLKLPNWSALTITEINPRHGEADGSTLRRFAERLAKSLAGAFQ